MTLRRPASGPRGYVQVPAAAAVAVTMRVHAGGRVLAGPQQRFNANHTQAVAQDYVLQASSPVVDVNWSACGATGGVRLDPELAVHDPGGSGARLTMDSLDGKVTSGPGYRQDAKIVWTRC